MAPPCWPVIGACLSLRSRRWARTTGPPPEQSVRGWERAIDAQRRVVRAVQALADADTTRGLLAIVSHGAVGTLLYCHLAGVPIARQWDQPPNRGGNFYRFTLAPAGVAHGWRPIDILPVAADTPVTHGLHRITH